MPLKTHSIVTDHSWPAETIRVILTVIIVLSVLDLVLEFFVGNYATISFTLLGIEAHSLIFGILCTYAFNVLCGHLFCPSPSPPPILWIRIILMAIALLPVAAVVFFLFWDKRGTTIPAFAFSYRWVAIICGVSPVGILAGRFLVPQHVGS